MAVPCNEILTHPDGYQIVCQHAFAVEHIHDDRYLTMPYMVRLPDNAPTIEIDNHLFLNYTMAPYEHAMELATRPLKCGYAGCGYEYGVSPIAFEDTPETRQAAQAFERLAVEHMQQAGHKQRRLAYMTCTQ